MPGAPYVPSADTEGGAVVSAATRAELLSPHCGCGCRPRGATEPGCGCPECQPGPGLDHSSRRNNLVATRRTRLKELIAEQEFRRLSTAEEEELEGLIHLYLHREA